jgi:cystathionine gamma-synthase
MRPETRLVRSPVDNPSGGISPVLDRSTTFERLPLNGAPYGRTDSPTAEEAEAVLGPLEDARALVFSSGMTAWATLCLARAAGRGPVVIPDQGYYGVEVQAQLLLDRLGVEVRRYDAADLPSLEAAAAGAALVLVETPSNPTMVVVDIARAAEIAHAAGAILCCDNTASTPLLQQPLALGADVTWQSATKYLAGHSDVIAGVLATRDEDLVEDLSDLRSNLGGILAPDGAWLLLRGLRTLGVRLERQCSSAEELARRLQAHPGVRHVWYAGLPDHRGHDLAARQMSGRFGALLSFAATDGETASRVEMSLGVIRRATSLGSVESLLERRARFETPGRVPEELLRLSVGLEDVEDLWEDLEQALASGIRTDARRPPQSLEGRAATPGPRP